MHSDHSVQLQPQRAPGKPRSLLVGVSCFAQLKSIQSSFPNPRLDLRYMVEGLINLLTRDSSLHADWLAASKLALVQHLAQHSGAMGAPAAHQIGTSLANTMAEGASARTHGGRSLQGATEPNCRSLQLGEAEFQRLRSVQGTTQNPRLEMRYLVEGAVALVHASSHLHADWVSGSRRALQTHLAALQQLPIAPLHMESQA